MKSPTTAIASAAAVRARKPAVERSRKGTAKSAGTRVAILEAAVKSLNQYGYRGTNLAQVAELAGVTRGCLQYYFLTIADVILALAQHIEQQQWETYVASLNQRAVGRDPIEKAIDMVASPQEDCYRAARLELIAASRTNPTLRTVLRQAAKQRDDWQRSFTDELFGIPGIADTDRFRGARDLTGIIDEWMFLHVFPDDGASRIEGVREALRVALHALWSRPPKTAGRRK